MQQNCQNSSTFADILSKAYPSPTIQSYDGINDNDIIFDGCQLLSLTSQFDEQFQVKYYEIIITLALQYIPSKRLPQWSFSKASKSEKVLWRCSPKGQITLAHFYSLLQLKHMKSLNYECCILISDLDAFLDKIKCPWNDLKVIIRLNILKVVEISIF